MWLCVVVHVRCWDSHFCLHRTLLARRVKGEGVGRWRIWGMWQRVRLLEKYIYAETFVSICQITWRLTYLLTHSLTPWRRVLLEKLTGSQLLKKLPSFYGTRRFITAFTSARHLSLPWASSIQSIHPHPTSCRSILILSFYLRLGLPGGLFTSGFPTKPLYKPLLLPPYLPHAPPISFTALQEYGRLLSLVHRVYAVICVIYWLSVARNGEMVGK